MKRFWPLPLLLSAYIILVVPFSSYMNNKPVIEKLGYVPQPEVLRFCVADQRIFVADSLVLKALFYFGSLAGKNSGNYNYTVLADYFGLYKTVETAVKLDPYNADGYYFTQAVITWDAQRIREANALLEYGMKYRDWDYQLPFFLGFNHAYFLKDYASAGKYYRRAADLSGEPLLARLASRYMYEAGNTGLALAYLETMEKRARNASIKKEFQVRAQALKEVQRVEAAVEQYRKDFGSLPASIDVLERQGFLFPPPIDPYGGKFFIDEAGRVKTSSNLAFTGAKKQGQKR